jgi:hypothetical protein
MINGFLSEAAKSSAQIGLASTLYKTWLKNYDDSLISIKSLTIKSL